MVNGCAVALEENRSQNGNQKKKFENVWQLKGFKDDYALDTER
jgi:hypothetical protein